MTRMYSASTGGLYEKGDRNVPDDAVEISDALYEKVKGRHLVVGPDGLPTLYDPDKDPEVLQSRFEQRIQRHLDDAAKARGYESISTAVSYAEEPAVPKFQNDGKAFRTWRSRVWAYAYQELARVKSGEREIPKLESFLTELPELEI